MQRFGKRKKRERERVEKDDDDDVERARLSLRSCYTLVSKSQAPKFCHPERAMIFSGEFQKKLFGNKTLNTTYNRV